MSMNVIEFEFLKCHLVNSCVRLYEFDDELEMTLSLWVSLSFHSLSIVWVWLKSSELFNALSIECVRMFLW